MSRLVVVSNRVGSLKNSNQAGGLAVAMADALRATGGLWFGWSGEIDERAEEASPQIEEAGRVRIATIPLTEREYADYYLGFSNQELWPVFHYRLDLAAFDRGFIAGYRRVNQRFAQSLLPLLAQDDTVWVHDYHLIPLGAELRARGAGQRIGFFLHIPWPPRAVFVATPEHVWLVRSMFAYDLVGFQTETDAAHFRRYVVEEIGGTDHGDGRLTAFGRTIRAEVFPIGIDVDGFRRMATTREAMEQIERLKRRMLGRAHIIGVDRLDYSKGLPDRFRAFQRLLDLYPHNRKAVTLTQIAPPTREDVHAYAEIRDELAQLSGQINGAYGDFDWTPVRYIHRPVMRRTLAAIFRCSEVGLVTPLRDGMNLVAKEYVAAQNPDSPGVLILSRFAGAAEDMEEALIINPYDVDGVVEALQRALSMRVEERRERHAALLDRIRKCDVAIWRRRFLDTLRAARVPA
ncbi:MAG: alpha,alpha-trehalose-phosphate synthase (UDP-forming) [Alphaproteobacteria bacterium]